MIFYLGLIVYYRNFFIGSDLKEGYVNTFSGISKEKIAGSPYIISYSTAKPEMYDIKKSVGKGLLMAELQQILNGQSGVTSIRAGNKIRTINLNEGDIEKGLIEFVSTNKEETQFQHNVGQTEQSEEER